MHGACQVIRARMTPNGSLSDLLAIDRRKPGTGPIKAPFPDNSRIRRVEWPGRFSARAWKAKSHLASGSLRVARSPRVLSAILPGDARSRDQ